MLSLKEKNVENKLDFTFYTDGKNFTRKPWKNYKYNHYCLHTFGIDVNNVQFNQGFGRQDKKSFNLRNSKPDDL